MDETLMTETAAPEATTPEAQAADTEAPGREAETQAETTAEGEARPGEGQPAGEGQEAADEAEAAPVFTVPVKYNKQYRELTPEEASVYAQKGMRYEALEPQLAKVRFMAARSGQPLEAVIERMYEASENAVRQEMLNKVGGDEKLADELMDSWRLQNRKAYDDMVAAEAREAENEAEDNNKRLAAEFVELRREFPELDKIEDVPRTVLQAAVRSGRDLLSEYLIYTHKESRRVAQAEAQRAAAAKASTGSQAGGNPPEETPEISALLAGIWR